MTKNYISLFLYFLVLIFLLQNISCISFLKKEYPQKKYFIISPNLEKATTLLFKSNNIKISKVKVSPFFEGKNFVYRQGENSYESDYYNEFLIFPAYNLNEVIGKWFSKSNPSESPQMEFLDSTYLLSTNIESMYVDFREEKIPKTMWDIVFLLQKYNDTNLLFKKRYILETRLESMTPENIIQSWNVGLTEILTSLQADLMSVSSTESTFPEKEKPSKVLRKTKKLK
jgi:cholesterol transport system auxiliary component